jgi:hypothetical protein
MRHGGARSIARGIARERDPQVVAHAGLRADDLLSSALVASQPDLSLSRVLRV